MAKFIQENLNQQRKNAHFSVSVNLKKTNVSDKKDELRLQHEC